MTAFRSIALTFLAVAGCSSVPRRPSSPPAEGAHLSTPVFASAASTRAEAPAVAEPAPSSPAPLPPGNMTGGKEHAMANCPSAVPGARTALIFTDDGVELVVTATAPDAQKMIRTLARRHAELRDPTGSGLHSGRHGGPGRIGYCPVIHHGHAIVTATDVAGGARIRIRGTSDDAVLDVQEWAALRVAGLPPSMPIGQPVRK